MRFAIQDNMKKISFYIFFLSFFFNIGFAQWINFTPDDEQGVYTFYDTSSITKSNDNTEVWTITNYSTPDSEGNYSNKILINFNCKDFSAEFIEAIVYKNEMAGGVGKSILDKLPSGFMDFDSNSVTYNLGKEVCK